MPRPKKTAEKRRSRQIIFRLTEDEYAPLSAVAERTGLTPNELGRRFALRGPRRLLIETSQRCDPAFLKRIDQIGNNLNQVVKNAHIFGRLSPRIEQLCETIDKLVTQAVENDTHDT